MKNLFLLIAAACVAVVGNQTYAQTKTRVGITAGVNYTTLGTAISSGISFKYDYRAGFQGGVYAEQPLSEDITFTPQIIFSQKGGNINTTISGITLKGTTQTNYLDIPLLFDFKMKSGISLFAGPQVSLLLSQTSTANASSPSGGSSSGSSSSTDGFRKTLFGGNLGIGYKFTDNINAKLHYLIDLQHTFDGSAGASDDGEKNSGFALTLGYSF